MGTDGYGLFSGVQSLTEALFEEDVLGLGFERSVAGVLGALCDAHLRPLLNPHPWTLPQGGART